MKFDQMSRVGFRGWQTWCLPNIRVQMGIVMWYFLSSQCSLICDLKIYSNLYPIHSSSRNICDSFLMSKLVDSWERTTIAASQPFSEKWLLCSCNIAHSGPEILKKSRQKNSWIQINQKIFSSNCIFGSFPSSKIDFWPILKLQKMEFGQKKLFLKLIYLFSRVFWPGLF